MTETTTITMPALICAKTLFAETELFGTRMAEQNSAMMGIRQTVMVAPRRAKMKEVEVFVETEQLKRESSVMMGIQLMGMDVPQHAKTREVEVFVETEQLKRESSVMMGIQHREMDAPGSAN